MRSYLFTFKKIKMKGNGLFEKVKVSNPKTNKFDLTHDVKTSFNAGWLIPTMHMECLPGDKIRLSADALCRLAPMVAPIMQRMDIRFEYFFVPYRLLWSNWETYIANNPNNVAHPYVAVDPTNVATYTKLLNYLGIPDPALNGGSKEEHISAFPLAAYGKIWNDYYRDQNLQTDLADKFLLNDGQNDIISNPELFELRRRAWAKDYFTSALPNAQKGNPATIPLGNYDDVPVYRDQNLTNTILTGTPTNVQVDGQLSENPAIPDDSLYANTSDMDVQSATINDLRFTFRLQEFLEKLMRAGSRYFEFIRSMFGVISPDARLQRPEYVNGTKAPIVISEVLNTTGTVTAPQGEMAGHGLAVTNGKGGYYECQEYGVMMCITSVMPVSSYMNGIDRHWYKINNPLEYFTPPFAHLGEQEITKGEIFAYEADTADTWGYQSRYSEYKFMNSRVTGEFQTSLDYWTQARKFANPPSLNATFIEADPDTRIYAVDDPTVDHFYVHILHRIDAIRPLPYFGTPSF